MLKPDDNSLLYGVATPSGSGEGLAPETADAYKKLQEKAGYAGFDLVIASGHRDFERQLLIWNRKACGEQPVLNDQDQVIEMCTLSDLEKVYAILRFSALPGASRHHWGTDIDVYDAAAVGSDYRLQLNNEEVSDEGVFGPLHQWLDQQIESNAAFGFFRPYIQDRGGVSPERWHLSYAPLSREFQKALSVNGLRKVLEGEDMALKDVVLDNLDDIYRRFIHVPFSIYPEEIVEY